MGMAAQLAAVSCAMLGGRQEAYGNRGIVCYWWVVMLVRLHRNGTLGEMCVTACQAINETGEGVGFVLGS